MKKILLFSFFLFSISFSSAQSGRPYAIWEDQTLSVYKYVRLDAATGVKTEVATVPGILGFVVGDRTAYDVVNNYYHFSALSGSGLYLLYTLNGTTGAVIHNPVISYILYGLEYNCADGMLYGLRNNSGIYDVVRIDPVTAAATSVAFVGGLSGYVSGSATLDPTLGYYTFKSVLSSTHTLRTYNINTGAMVANVPFPDNVVGQRFSCLNNAIYGLWEDAGVYKLERISPISGTHTTIGTLTGVDPGHVMESTSVDPSGYYTFRGFDTSGFYRLFTVDLFTASITAGALTTDNAVGFEEPNCCSLPTSVNESKEETLSIYPIPANDELSIEFSSGTERMEIFSIEGKKIVEKNILNESQIKLDLSEWPAGVYLLRMYSNTEISQKRFVVVKQ